MPTLQDVYNWWKPEGGDYYQFIQSEFLRGNPSVTTIRYKNKTESRVTTDVSGGICHALSLRFI